MSKAFPTKKELAIINKRRAVGFTFAGSLLWAVTYTTGIMFIYGLVCPPLLLFAVRYSYKMLRGEHSVMSYILLVLSVIFFLLSLAPWFFPIATSR